MRGQSGTGLKAKVIGQIRKSGPMSIARYMSICLLDPEFGYYRTAPVFGRDGDFITAPEISQIFGELLGLWAGLVWQSMGAPEKFNLVELGPGRGTMIADALRALKIVPGAGHAASVHLIEVSAPLRDIQRATLAGCGALADWHDDTSTLPAGPTIVLANEFLDAIPIRQFVKTGNGWCERLIGMDGEENLQFVLADKPVPEPVPAALPADAGDGDIVETRDIPADLLPNPDAGAHAPLAALFIDYGHVQTAPGDSFQAVKNHQYADPLQQPGTADLTAHVDFMAFADNMRARGYRPSLPLTQGEFLTAMGIVERARRLMETATVTQRNEFETALARLISPDGMGVKFKAMGLRSHDCPPLPVFQPATS